MPKLNLSSDSTLTDRYQTTIPEVVRKALDLKKRDKIRYTIQPDGSVNIARVDQDDNDPVLTDFLSFLAKDISQNPENVSSINSELADRIKPLISDMEIDINSSLSDQDDS